MKKIFILFAASLLALAGCSRNQEIDIQENGLSLFARTESPADTKTVVESGVHVYWEPGDEIAVFMGEKSAKFTTDITASSVTATFKGTFGNATWPEELDLWAVYPFSEDAVCDGETITTTLPSEQIAREGSFGKDMNLSIAHSNSTTLQFYNVGGGIRFSVTEEGIKKVMFEGLSGEIISGKVKIGFENGLPVVKEVTGGCQFITLLPPTGKETFEKDTWYYIVAIPGTLEGGYKLRFYKDSDYARKVSEKAVMIKRSIYGNIEKADLGIEYEATTTHFPETKEEIFHSIEISQNVSMEIKSIVEKLKKEENSDLYLLAAELTKCEDVLNVHVNSNGQGLVIQQRDSVFFNYYPTIGYNSIDEELGEGEPTMQSAYLSSIKNTYTSNSSSSKRKKRALLFYPAENLTHITNWKESINEYLTNAGFQCEPFYNNDADILLFRGDVLDDYDFIHIAAHGCVGAKARMRDGEYAKSDIFSFVTGTPFSKTTAEKLIDNGNLTWEQVMYVSTQDGSLLFCAPPDLLDNASFQNTCVITTSCESAEEVSGYSYMMHKFLSKGAAVFSGYLDTIEKDVGSFIDKRVIDFLCHGFSFQESADYWKNNPSTVILSNSRATRYRQWGSQEGWDYSVWRLLGKMEADINMCDYHLYTYEMHPSYLNKPYYLIDAQQIELQDANSVSPNSSYTLSWECGLESFTIKDSFMNYIGSIWETYQPYEYTHDYTVHYDVYVNDIHVIDNEDTDKEITLTPSSYGTDKWNWYVVAKVMEGDTVIASYQSDEGHFTAAESSQPNNIIYYTSTNGEIVTPSAPDAFKANIISNVFTDGKGVITFNQDITQVGDSAFEYCTNLSSISLPGSVQIIGAGAFVYCTSLRSVNLSKDITIYDRAFSKTALSGTVHVNAFYGNAFEDTNVEDIYTYSTVKDDYSGFEQCLRGIPDNSTIHVNGIIYHEMTGIVDAQLTRLETDIQKVIDDSYASIYLMENYLAMIEKDIICMMDSGYTEDIFDHARQYILTLYERISLYELWLKENYEMLTKKTPYLTPFFMDSYNYYMSKIEDHFYYANNKLFELDHRTQRLENELYELRPYQSPTNANRQTLSAQTKKVYTASSSSSIPAVTADLFHSHTVSFTPSE